jgi:hypothetical protein
VGKPKHIHEARLRKGQLPQTRLARLARIKEIKQAHARSRVNLARPDPELRLLPASLKRHWPTRSPLGTASQGGAVLLYALVELSVHERRILFRIANGDDRSSIHDPAAHRLQRPPSA